MYSVHRRFASLLAALTLCVAIAPAKADVMLDIFGTPGSSQLTLTMSGSLTYVDDTSGATSSTDFMRFPVVDPDDSWFTPSISWGGDALWNTSIAFQSFLADSSTLMLSITGDHTQSYTFDSIAISSSPDGFLIPSNSSLQGSYPALDEADITLTVSGSAVFTLPGGLTFDNLNQGTRTSTFPYEGDVFQTVEVQSVPAPTTTALLALGLLGLVRGRFHSRGARETPFSGGTDLQAARR